MKNFLEKTRRKTQERMRGFTLVEVLIASTIFTAVGLITVGIFINITRIQARVNLENAIYEDARFMMERIAREIRTNAVDYEEYFNKNFTNGMNVFPYGQVYGCYAAQFYNPGQGIVPPGIPTNNADSLGAKCNDGNPATQQNCVVFKPSLDINTGQNPYVGRGNYLSSQISAFCADSAVSPPAYQNALKQCTGGTLVNLQPELYLISKDGKQKTLFAKKIVDNNPSSEFALGMLRLNGEDSDNDGIFEKWQNCTAGSNPFCCASGFDCTLNAPANTLEKTLTQVVAGNPYKGFVPISPLRTSITNLAFLIQPLEDPQKAFAETDILAQPKITITLTVRPSASELKKYNFNDPQDLPQITLQTTISTRIQSEVKSYLGKLPADCPY